MNTCGLYVGISQSLSLSLSLSLSCVHCLFRLMQRSLLLLLPSPSPMAERISTAICINRVFPLFLLLLLLLFLLLLLLLLLLPLLILMPAFLPCLSLHATGFLPLLFFCEVCRRRERERERWASEILSADKPDPKSDPTRPDPG